MVYVIVRGDRKGKDRSDVPLKHRVLPIEGGIPRTPDQAKAVERRHQEQMEALRKQARRDSRVAPKVRQVAQIPAELYFGKIRETGDRDYWKDKKNVKQHRDCLVRPGDL